MVERLSYLVLFLFRVKEVRKHKKTICYNSLVCKVVVAIVCVVLLLLLLCGGCMVQSTKVRKRGAVWASDAVVCMWCSGAVAPNGWRRPEEAGYSYTQ